MPHQQTDNGRNYHNYKHFNQGLHMKSYRILNNTKQSSTSWSTYARKKERLCQRLYSRRTKTITARPLSEKAKLILPMIVFEADVLSSRKAHKHTHTHLRIRAHTQTHIHTNTNTRTNTNTHKHTQARKHTHTHTRIYSSFPRKAAPRQIQCPKCSLLNHRALAT